MSLVGFEWTPCVSSNHRFIGIPYETGGILATISATLTFVFPHAKRSRIAAVYAAPFIHMAGLIGSKGVGAPPMELFRRSGQCRPK
jgi:hypothetical protein